MTAAGVHDYINHTTKVAPKTSNITAQYTLRASGLMLFHVSSSGPGNAAIRYFLSPSFDSLR